MKIEQKKRKQVLLRLPEELVEFLKGKARDKGLKLTRFCETYLSLVQFLEFHHNLGQIITRQTKRRLLMIPAAQYDQMYGANATYREGRRLGLDWATMLGKISVEDTLTLFSIYGWGIFEFQAEEEKIICYNPPISSSEFVRGLIEGLIGVVLQTLTADREIFLYKILL